MFEKSKSWVGQVMIAIVAGVVIWLITVIWLTSTPKIVYFQAEPDKFQYEPGQNVKLRWKTIDSDEVILTSDDRQMNKSELSEYGNTLVKAKQGVSTTYTLTVKNGIKSNKQSLTISTQAAPISTGIGTSNNGN